MTHASSPRRRRAACQDPRTPLAGSAHLTADTLSRLNGSAAQNSSVHCHLLFCSPARQAITTLSDPIASFTIRKAAVHHHHTLPIGAEYVCVMTIA